MSDDQHASTEPPSSSGLPADGGRRPGPLRRWLQGLRNGRNGPATLRETLEGLIEHQDENAQPVDPREWQLIEKILDVGRLTVEDVMVPRADIVAVECQTPLEDVIALMANEAHSRLPVYRETLDDVIGMVHIKDVLAATTRKQPVQLRDLLRKVLIVAPSMRVLDLLLQMRTSRNHMALVVDEYGGIDGLVTIEDTIEPIVGEIEDEHEDGQRPLLEEREDGTIVADARVPIEDCEARIGSFLTEEEREEDIDTLGGLVFSLAGRVPLRGEVLRHDPSGMEFEVIDADPRRIRRLRLCNMPPRPAARPVDD